MEKTEFYKHIKKAVVIPCYRVSAVLRDLIENIPENIVDHIIVVDDACPNGAGALAEELKKKDCTVMYHNRNQGVGGAVISGYRKALDLGCDIIVKLDGDGQMDPAYMKSLMTPLVHGLADYAKGNRFTSSDVFKKMPKIRLLGNSILSFLIKGVSGYWDIMDPTNGYTAVHRRALEKIDLDKVSKGYFFEINMLIDLSITDAVVKDVSIPAKYSKEESSLSISKVLVSFPPKLVKGFLKRIFMKYFIYDFNMASVYIVLGIPLFFLGIFWGIHEWMISIVTGEARSAGTIMLVALPIIISFQMLLQAINIDIQKTPRRKWIDMKQERAESIIEVTD